MTVCKLYMRTLLSRFNGEKIGVPLICIKMTRKPDSIHIFVLSLWSNCIDWKHRIKRSKQNITVSLWSPSFSVCIRICVCAFLTMIDAKYYTKNHAYYIREWAPLFLSPNPVVSTDPVCAWLIPLYTMVQINKKKSLT